MSYVDPNPIRAGIAATLEESDFTSIQQRRFELAAERTSGPTAGLSRPRTNQGPIRLKFYGFAAPGASPGGSALALGLDDYVELLRSTATAPREPSPQAQLPVAAVPTLERLGICADRWLETLRFYHQHFFAMVGCVHQINVYCARTDRDHAKGRRWAAQAFRDTA